MNKHTLNDFDEYFRMHGGTLWGVSGVHVYLSNFYEKYGDKDKYDPEQSADDRLIDENKILEFIENSKETILQGTVINLYTRYYKDDFTTIDEFMQNLKPVSVYIKNQDDIKAELFLNWESDDWRKPKRFENCFRSNILSIRVVLKDNNKFEYFDNNGRQPYKGDN